MTNVEFSFLLLVVFIPGLVWGCKSLLHERWQILAAIPSRKNHQCEEGAWQGRNLTFYGVLLANGCLAGAAVFLLLCSSIGLDLLLILVLTGSIMSASMFAASVLARLIEKRKNTLTVAGGATVGLYLLPVCIVLINNTYSIHGITLPLLPIMAATSIGFILGEGLGRMACISFGCCYGKAISELTPFTAALFSRIGCIFHGHTRKIAYASHLDGIKVVPIQAITSFLYVIVAVACIYLFLENHFAWAFGLSATVSMGWRVLSEQLRADYRGGGKFTIYQKMSMVNILFCLVLLVCAAPIQGVHSDLMTGLSVFWYPAVILFLQTIWGGIFLCTGVSKVTYSTVTFMVHPENIQHSAAEKL